jgi:hypothetical protein
MNQLSIFDPEPTQVDQINTPMYIVSFKTNRIEPVTLTRLKQWIKCISQPMERTEIDQFIQIIKTNNQIKRIKIKTATGNPAAANDQKPTF